MSDSSPTRRVALGALGVTVVGAAIGAGYHAKTPPKPAGGAVGPTARSPLSLQVEDALKAAADAPRSSASASPRSAPSLAARKRPAPHPDDLQGRPDTLANRAILSGGEHRRILYTWTTPEQIDALRAGGRLLHRTHSPRHGHSRFDKALQAHPKQGLAPWLLKRQNRFRRFAWPYPWATLMGWPGETYGDRLLRIELKPCQTARVRFTTAGAFDHSFGEGFAGVTGTWSQTDRVNTIGAVYHEHVTHYRPPQNSYQPWGSSLREYVLFSETHIARFSHGDPACLAALRADIAFLNQVKSALAQFNEDAGAGGFPKRIKTVDDRWRANLAFHNGDYAPRVQAVDAVIKALRDALKTQGPPLVRG